MRGHQEFTDRFLQTLKKKGFPEEDLSIFRQMALPGSF
jgi:hypothetical protein